MPARPIFIRSAETNALIKLFREMPLDSPMSFLNAAKTLGFAINTKENGGAYYSARKIAERHHGVVIDGIRGVGFVKLRGDQISESGERDILAIRRRARRAGKRQEIAIATNLDQRHMMRSSELLNRFRIVADAVGRAMSNKRAPAEPQAAEPVDPRDALRSMTT
jgi:hypothetical protein